MNLTSYQKTRVGLIAWGAAGLLLTLGAVSLGAVAWVISIVLLLIATVAGAPGRPSALFLGASVPLVLVVVGNVGGPGWSCHSSPTGSGCDELLDPRPYLVVALVVFAIGTAIELLLRRASSRGTAIRGRRLALTPPAAAERQA